MQTIFITAFQPFISRNILNTGVLDELLARGMRVVLFVPIPKVAFYIKVYGTRGVLVEGVDFTCLQSTKERFFQRTAELLIDTNTKRFHKMIERYEGGSLVKYATTRAVTALCARANWLKRLFRFVEYQLHQPDCFVSYFHKYQPDVVFATNLFGDIDATMIKTARQRKVHSVGMVLSWDNPTSKQLVRAIPNVVFAHNEVICGELLNLHALVGAQAVGVPHYDYVKSYQAVPREIFFAHMQIPADRTLVLLSPAGKKFIDTDWQIFQILKEARIAGAFSKPVHFLIRVHPTNKIDFGSFVPDEFFTIEEPGVRFEGVREKDNELDLEGFNHLLDTIEHSAVVVNTLSSIVIDACVRDRPVVTIGFDGLEVSVPFERSVKLYHTEENMAKLLTTKGAPVACSPQELVTQIERYIRDPSADHSERNALVAQQCLVLDGCAKKRIADAVLKVSDVAHISL